jgi:predicted DNA-binding protein
MQAGFAMQGEAKTEVVIGRVPVEMAADIRHIAARLDKPVSQVLRDAISRYLAEPPEGLVYGRVVNV